MTNQCNASCHFCSYREKRNQNIDELTFDEIKKISKTLGTIKLVAMSGGEPFLRPDLKDIVQVFVEQNNTENIWIPTNGILTEEIVQSTISILEKIGNAGFQITVSIDGMETVNDKQRSPGCFRKSLDTIRKLCEIRDRFPSLSVKIVTTVTRNNYQGVESLAAFVQKELDVDDHYFQPARKTLENKTVAVISGREWFLLSKRLFKYRRHYLGDKEKLFIFLHFFGDRLMNIFMSQAMNGMRWPFPCIAGANIGVLEPDGSLRLCELTERIGNLRDYNYDFQEIWQGRAANVMRRRIGAGDCSVNCTHGCFLKPSIVKHPFHVFIRLIKSPFIK